MQNRNDRNRGYDDNQSNGWRDDDVTWETRDRNRDEGRSWSSGGADRDFRRTEGYGQSSGGDYGRSTSYEGYGSSSYGAARNHGGGRSDWNRDNAGGRYGQSPRSGEFGQDYGYNRAYGQGSNRDYGQGRGSYGVDSSRDYRGGASGGNYQGQGYAPGAEIWEGRGGASTGGRNDYEPDYLHWRDQQMSKFDRDYDDWRNEKRQKFSSDFDTWRTSRNAIVENVSDGGTGSQKDVKNS